MMPGPTVGKGCVPKVPFPFLSGGPGTGTQEVIWHLGPNVGGTFGTHPLPTGGTRKSFGT